MYKKTITLKQVNSDVLDAVFISTGVLVALLFIDFLFFLDNFLLFYITFSDNAAK